MLSSLSPPPCWRTCRHNARGRRRRSGAAVAALVSTYTEVPVDTSTASLERKVGLLDITQLVRDAVARSGVRNGLCTVTSRHTTTALCVNENEERLFTDVQRFLLRLAPPEDTYRHNDIDQRFPPPGWHQGVDEWRAQEPINAHSHLLSMLLGSCESFAVSDGKLQIGQWQSLLLIELDGPRQRKVGVHVLGE